MRSVIRSGVIRSGEDTADHSMSRYRSEIPSLEARARELEQEILNFDGAEGVGLYASSNFALGMYFLGLRVGS